MLSITEQLPSLSLRKLFEHSGEAYHAWNSQLEGYVPPHPELPAPFTTARELRAARDHLIRMRDDIRGRMIFLQEEMDWVAYDMYGLLKARPPLAEDYLAPRDYRAARLRLGQRPFEVAGRGYTGDWPKGYRPAPVPAPLEALTEARQRVIEANPDIALLEDPLYKRRWIPPDYAAEFREAAEWWLAEKLEYALEQNGRPLSLQQWARLLVHDVRVNAVLEVLTGTLAFDLEGELLKVIQANAAPNRPEHYLKPSGLRKFYVSRVGNEELGIGNGELGMQNAKSRPVPTYKRRDFSDATAWRIRGKLNIPRERFIYYAEFDHSQRGVDAPDGGGPWFGWAGWDAVQRAEALVYLVEQAARAGWTLHWRQCGLRAALRDLLPELGGLPKADRAEFQAIAEMCGMPAGTRCYCQGYRDAAAAGEPGVPGVGEESLGVKVVRAVREQRGRYKVAGDVGAEQLGLDL